MNVGFPIVCVINAKWHAATVTRRIPEPELPKGVDMACDLTYFDPQLRSWQVLEHVPYFNGPELIPATGVFFVECGADTNEERQEQQKRRAEYQASRARYAELAAAAKTRELTNDEGAEFKELTERWSGQHNQASVGGNPVDASSTGQGRNDLAGRGLTESAQAPAAETAEDLPIG